MESGAETNDLLSSYQFRSVGGGLNGGLAFGKPFNWSLVDKVHNAGDSPASDPIMVEAGIHMHSEDDAVAKGWGHVCWECLLHCATHSVQPVMLLGLQV